MVKSIQITELTISGTICRAIGQPLNKVKNPIFERSRLIDSLDQKSTGKLGRSPTKTQFLKPSACFDVAH